MTSQRVTMQSGATGTGNGVSADVSNYDAAGFQVQGINGDTITWETSIDGTNWIGIRLAPTTTGTLALTTTADGVFVLDCSGLALVRARISAYGSGTINVTALLHRRGN